MKNLLSGLFLLTLGVVFTTTVYAGTTANCIPIYGGGQTCIQSGNLVINKTVQNPQTNAFVDNLNINDPKYAPTQTVTFQLVVTNTGGTALSNITVKDIFPQFVEFVSGPGNFDKNSKTLTFTINKLNPNESQTFTLTAKVVDASQLTSNQPSVCVVNQANATVNKQTSQDNAQFCIQKQAAPAQPVTTKGGLQVFAAPQAQTTPSTGPESLALMALIPTGALGFILRKKSAIR